MTSKLWPVSATKMGEMLAEQSGMDSFPIDPAKIAAQKDIVVQPLPSNRKTVSGMLVRNGNLFGIQYATYLNHRGFENFSIAHELGHYHIPGHAEALLETGVHYSKAGFSSSERRELEADHFAAGLLMPNKLFRKEINRHESGLKAVELLSSACETSLTATAIRYAQLTPDPIVIIVSEQECVNYCFMSEEFREIPGLEWLRKGSLLPDGSCTLELNQSPKSVRNADKAEAETNIGDWFGSSLDIEVYEECVGLGGYGKTLTVLSIHELPDAEELEERARLEESWKPRFRK